MPSHLQQAGIPGQHPINTVPPNCDQINFGYLVSKHPERAFMCYLDTIKRTVLDQAMRAVTSIINLPCPIPLLYYLYLYDSMDHCISLTCPYGAQLFMLFPPLEYNL